MAGVGIIAAGAQLGLQSIVVKPRRSIGTLSPQVTISELHTDELDITDHPVERGSVITDHSYKRPAEVVIECGWSNSPSETGYFNGLLSGLAGTVTGVQSLLSGNSANQVREWYTKLLKLQADREPFDVYTGKRVYKNMLIRQIITRTDKNTENVLMVTVTLREVLLVSTKVVTLAADKNAQMTPDKTQPISDRGTQALGPGSSYTTPGPSN